jgi:7,8-dihydropterin-6-yl-methyl-4-(beta-D-ribofuranosyl)aminobenzene 5'-phosphate synthase
VKEGEIMRQDNLADDQALIIKTTSGLVVILGCAHRGVINTIRLAQEITGVQTVHTVLGGTHLFEALEEQIWLTIAALKEMGIQKLGVSHCTGLKPSVLLAHEFGDAFFFNNTGTKLTIPA